MHALERDRDRWRLRALDAERRYREREPALRHLRAEIDGLRSDRDQWRAQAQRLAGSLPPPRSPRSTSARAAAWRAANAVWRFLPEPGKRLARPAIGRLRARRSPPAAPDRKDPEPSGDPAPIPVTDRPSRDARGLDVSETISVIIPTLNAGPTFARVLDAIRAQEGVGGLEVLVVDSGSSDETVALARGSGARVVQIPAEEFGHGASRDRMAEICSGEILLMTVQDAVMVGCYVIRDLARCLEADPSLAAVSACQVPAMNGDLFGAFLALDHQRQIASQGVNGNDVWVRTLTGRELQARSRVDNVCAAIRRSAWEVLRFRDVDFAEDLDFGLRALEQGWTTGMCPSAAVVHSHTRDAGYHLRRFVTNRLCLAAQLGEDDFKPVAAAGVASVAAGARALLWEVQAALSTAADDGNSVDLASYLARVESMLAIAPQCAALEGDLAILGDLLDGDLSASPDPSVTAGLRQEMLSALGAEPVLQFARVHESVALDEAGAFVAKLFASAIGQILADAMRDTHPLTPLALRLRAGV